MFINRTNELKALDAEYKSPKSSFSIIYGRRRVGKTALITEFIKDKPHIYLYITLDSLSLQLEGFTQEIKKLADKSFSKHLKFDSFEEGLEFLSSLELKRKLVVAIDEYQFLVQKDRAFSSKLQKVWDMKLQHSNIYLILCGSSISMMHSEALDYSAPLYGRRTSQFHIKPIRFTHLQEFLPSLTRVELMNVYSSFGTIPKYLNEYDETLSFMQNIEQKILNKNSYLYNEGLFLLKDEIGEPASFFSILKAISIGNTKIGNIASYLSVSSSYLSKYMEKLITLDLVEKEVPITEKNPLKSKLGRYKIKDKFLNFWFFYVYKNFNYLEIEQSENVLKEIETNFNDRFVSFAFEECMIEQIVESPYEFLDFTPLKIGRWWSNKEEIDIVAFDDKNIAFIECKWQNTTNKELIKKELIQKSRGLEEDKKTTYLVITKEDYLNGF